MQRATEEEACLGTSEVARFSVGALSIAGFERPFIAATAIFRYSRRSKGLSSPRSAGIWRMSV
jgi:hypothetical protein